MNVPGTTMTNVNAVTVSVPLFATNAAPGWHSLLAVINNGDRSRYLYAPELVQVIANPRASSRYRPDQRRTISESESTDSPIKRLCLRAVQTSQSWQALSQRTPSRRAEDYTNTPASGTALLFYAPDYRN